MSYATVAQYEARFGEVTDESLLQECLDDSTAVIDAALDSYGIDHDAPTEDFSDRLMRVCRSMANRLYPTESDGIPQGVSSFSETAGAYSQSFSFGTSYGTPKLLPSEMRLLGIPSTYLGAYRPKIHGWYGTNDGAGDD